MAVPLKMRAKNEAVPFYKWEAKKPVAVHRNGVKYFQKMIYLNIMSNFPGGKIYFPYDSDLKASLVTEIQVIPEGDTNLPFAGSHVAEDQSLQQLTVTFINWKGSYQVDQLPLTCLIHNFFNNQLFWQYFRLNYVPEKSFLSTPDGSAYGSGNQIVFLFTYKML